jgi:hypothetical protein
MDCLLDIRRVEGRLVDVRRVDVRRDDLRTDDARRVTEVDLLVDLLLEEPDLLLDVIP